MLGYEFEIIYKKGKQNVVEDALSRMDEDVEAFICAINGVIFVVVWKEVLYHHSAKGNHLTHCVCLSVTKQQRYPSKHLFTISVFPSD